MSGADALKAQIKSVADQRASLEREIAQRSARLEAAGVGLTASLVDSEVRPSGGGCGPQHVPVNNSVSVRRRLKGFPRADVDVAAIRADRHAIISAWGAA